MPTYRTASRWIYTTLAVAGWVGALWSWLDHGPAAGINAGFMTALSVGIAFTCAATREPTRTRDDDNLFALGYRQGRADEAKDRAGGAEAPTPQQNGKRVHLSAV